MNRMATVAGLVMFSGLGCQSPAESPMDGANAVVDMAAARDLADPGPTRLSQTGLYSDFAQRTIAAGVFRYSTQFPTWTDGTSGDQFLLLPAGTKIDTSDMDRWVFPVGTKSWREIRAGQLLVETRFMQKMKDAADGWFEMSYVWQQDGSDAVAAPDGAAHANGLRYVTPAQADCPVCHLNVRDGLIGASAIQLSRPDGKGPLSQLAAKGLLTNPPAAEFPVPGVALEQSALGYLHSNCGYCHYDKSLLKKTLTLNLDVKTTDRVVADTAAYRTAINAKAFHPQPPDIVYCVLAGQPDKSQLWTRMGLRDDWAMPNLDTAVVDDAGVALIRDWISALPH